MAVGACASVPTQRREIAPVECCTTSRHGITRRPIAVETRLANSSLSYRRPGIYAPDNTNHDDTCRQCGACSTRAPADLDHHTSCSLGYVSHIAGIVARFG